MFISLRVSDLYVGSEEGRAGSSETCGVLERPDASVHCGS